MRRHTAPWLVAAFLLSASSASAGEMSDRDRFELWNGCKNIGVEISELSDDGKKIALREDDIGAVVRSRLRGARIYDDMSGPFLYANIHVVNHAYHVAVEFVRNVEVVWHSPEKPEGTGRLTGYSSTWRVGSTGTHANNPGFILSQLTRQTDKFVDEYLRVNADACQ